MYRTKTIIAETDMTARLTSARRSLCGLITSKEHSELDESGIFDAYEIPQMPYDADIHELRERLKPYLHFSASQPEF